MEFAQAGAVHHLL